MMVFKVLAAACAWALASAAAGAQEDAPTPDPKTEILATLDAFFVAFHEKDVEGMGALMLMPGHARAVNRGEDGALTLNKRSLAEFPEFIANSPDTLLEVYWDPTVQIHNDLVAHVWAPFVVQIDGATARCGIDLVTMVNTDFGWRIVDLTYAGRKEDCASLQPGDPADIRPAALADTFLAGDG